MFTTDLYLRFEVNRVRARNVDAGQTIERIPKSAFSHPRMLIGNFAEAQAIVKAAVNEVKGSAFLKALRIVMHPTEIVTGGLSQVEERVLHELALGAGAGKVVVWVGRELNDDEVRAKLRGE